MPEQKILIDGTWCEAQSTGTFKSINPTTGMELPYEYPISAWADCAAALDSAVKAAAIMREAGTDLLSNFLNRFADRIERRAAEIVEMAHAETALPKSPRLAEVELPRTTGQLRQAAKAATEGSWALPTIEAKPNIRSCHSAIGPVCVFGPNNFPFAYNGVCGGDFAAAIAAGNPVIAKAHPSHPGTTRLLAEEAFAAVGESGLPHAAVQLIYHLDREEGLRLVSDIRLGATGFTGSRVGGLALKSAADAAGKPIYLEMSSLNPVVVLPGALQERIDKIAEEYADSCLGDAGQFCTKPGLLFLVASDASEDFVVKVSQRFAGRAVATLLSPTVKTSLDQSVKKMITAGAQLLIGGSALSGESCRYSNTLLRVDGKSFLKNPHALQTEAFGNASMIIITRDVQELEEALTVLDGQLTGSIYASTGGEDDKIYSLLSPILRRRVGRFINNKMPTGVAVTPAMNHGGPYPATGHPGFTAVGIPASMRRFSQLECYDNVRADRLPPSLRDRNPNGSTWRLINGEWSRSDVTA